MQRLLFDGDELKKTFTLVTLCALLGSITPVVWAQSFAAPAAPACPADASPGCALHAKALTACKGSRSPAEFGACMNTTMSSANASEVEKNKSAHKALRAKEEAALVASMATVSYSPPAAPVCPKAGVPGVIECELAKRAFAACHASKSAVDFSACVRSYSSTKPLTCTLAADAAEAESCKQSNKSRG